MPLRITWIVPILTVYRHSPPTHEGAMRLHWRALRSLLPWNRADVREERRASPAANSVRPGEGSSPILLQSAKGVAVVGCIALSPFALNNLLAGRYLLGIGSSIITAHLAFNAYTIYRHGRYHHRPMLFVFTPALIFFLYRSVEVQGVIGLLWCFPTVVALYFMLPRRLALLADILLILVIVPTAVVTVDTEVALRFGITLVMVVMFTARFVRLLAKQEEKLRVQAVTDSLTGLQNRTLLDATLQEAITRGLRTSSPMTLLLLDIDHFKRINDTAGHDAGDEVIRVVARMLQDQIRETDSAFRVGGEEFVVLMPDTDALGGALVAERLRGHIETVTLQTTHPVTVSLGVATLRPTDTTSEWLKRTDNHLYLAKETGRNRVVGDESDDHASAPVTVAV